VTRELCTLFDSNYLVKALAMHRSLMDSGADFHLTAFCFDDRAYELLERLDLDRVSAVALAELEAFDRELAGVKDDRTPTEYCWTATPALPRYVLGTRPEVDEVTYLDADLLFFADPEPLFAEMGDASVLITPHRYAPEYAHLIENGVYNVQFMVFRRDPRGTEALEWWHDRCIEWCYYRLEDGKLGDQKYLDDWPERFAGVHVLEHKGGGLAPWNATQYDVRRSGDRVLVDEDPLIFFHYHRVGVREKGRHEWRPPGFAVTPAVRRLVYGPYMAALDDALGRIRAVDPGFRAGVEAPTPRRQVARTRAVEVASRVRSALPGRRSQA
jgi:hypothetical protein